MFWDDSEEDEEVHLASLLSGLSLPEDPDGGVDEHWTRVDSFKMSVGMDVVDQHLLTVAQEELEVVAGLLMRKMFGKSRHTKKNVKPGEVLQAFLNLLLLTTVCLHINQHIGGDKLSADEVVAFIRVELFLSAYGCCPTQFFHLDNQSLYPTAGCGMSHRGKLKP